MGRGASLKKLKDDGRQELRWGIERRLEFIDFRLFWEGRINRSDLTDQFGISTPQASADLARYQELAPANLVYDSRLKCYLATGAFRSAFDVEDSSRYLAQLRSIANGTVRPEEAWLADPPNFRVVPAPGREVDTRFLKAVLNAIREGDALRIRYQSMSKPEVQWRWITPHALGFDGFRWHARAFCHKDETFKDFVFARILDIGETKPHAVDSANDRAWLESVMVVITPHPGLSDGQRRAIELDYGMSEGERAIEVPKAFLYYFLKRLGLDGDSGRKRPQDQHIVLVNRKEVRDALSGAMPRPRRNISNSRAKA